MGGEGSEWEGRWEALREAEGGEGKGVVLGESGGDDSDSVSGKERRERCEMTKWSRRRS